MDTCKTCKYWRRKAYRGTCKCPKFVEYTAGMLEQNDTLIYWDYEGYSAGFDVGKDFGCIHHEEQPK